MIIFGWGFRTKRELGPLGPYKCNACDKVGYFILVRAISWFSIFFIPMVPYSKKYYAVCPNCKNVTELGPESVKELRELAEKNKAALQERGRVSPSSWN